MTAMPKDTYSEKEVARIIKRAAELESKQSDDYDSLDSGPGLSLDELSQIAIDAGLDPNNVRKAANEISSESDAEKQTVTYQNNEVITELWITADFPDEVADLVISDLNHRYNTTHEKPNWKDNILNDATVDPERQSSVQRTSNSLEWKKLNKHGSEEVRVLIQQRKDQVRIVVTKQADRGNKLIAAGNTTGLLPYIPYVAGVFLLFALPFSFWINAIIGIISFALLQYTINKKSGLNQEKASGSTNPVLDSHRSEVQSVARDLAKLIEQPSSENSTIDIEEETEIKPDNTGTEQSGTKRSRNRSR